MPNWCFNNLRLEHDNPAMITRVIDAFRADRLLQEFIPVPSEPVSCEWTERHWGTKWEIEGKNRQADSLDVNSVTLDFDTANNAPIPLFQVLRGLGFQVIAMWTELGCRFCGSYSDTGAVKRYDIPFTVEECRERIPSEIDDAFGISDYVEESA